MKKIMYFELNSIWYIVSIDIDDYKNSIESTETLNLMIPMELISLKYFKNWSEGVNWAYDASKHYSNEINKPF